MKFGETTMPSIEKTKARAPKKRPFDGSPA